MTSGGTRTKESGRKETIQGVDEIKRITAKTFFFPACWRSYGGGWFKSGSMNEIKKNTIKCAEMENEVQMNTYIYLLPLISG